MKIIIKSVEENKNIRIKLPMCVITTIVRFGKIENKININKEEYNFISYISKNNNKKNIIKGLKYLNKKYKGLVIVDVQGANGDVVKIEI